MLADPAMRYTRPGSLEEILAVLAKEADKARILVGGTDLLVGLRHRTINPAVIVDIKDADGLPDPLLVDDQGVTIGPTLTMAEVERDERLRAWFPALAEAAESVGSVAIRNRASLIGNICNGSPAADTAPALLAHGAEVTITGLDGSRTVPVEEFFLGPRRTMCRSGQMVTSLRIPRPEAGTSSASARMTRRRGVDLATIIVAARVDPTDHVTLAVGAAGPIPRVATSAEPVELDSVPHRTAALGELLAISSPIGDVRASLEYRQAMLRVLAGRVLTRAATRRTTSRSTS